MIEESPFLTIRRNFPRPDPAKVAALKGVQSGIAVDCLMGSGALHHTVKPMTSSMSPAFTGVAVTCDCGPADNLAVFAALDLCRPGDVVMIRTGDHLACAVIGDMVAGMYSNAGAVGMVTDGAVRDVTGIDEAGVPCFAAAVSPNSPARGGPGTAGLPIVMGGVPVDSGDVIVADADGVTVVPQGRLHEVVARLPVVLAAEKELEAKVKSGLVVPDFAREILDGECVREVD
ncbi:MAG: RraA family protein [Pseudomonadota bacterium]